MYVRDELRFDEVTNGFAASVAIDEGTKDGNGNDRLDAGDRDEYEIRWWAVAVDQAGNVGVSDQERRHRSAIRGRSERLPDRSALLEFDDGSRRPDEAKTIIRALEETMEAQDQGLTTPKGCDPHVIRVDSANPVLSLAETGFYLDGDEEKDEAVPSPAWWPFQRGPGLRHRFTPTTLRSTAPPPTRRPVTA